MDRVAMSEGRNDAATSSMADLSHALARVKEKVTRNKADALRHTIGVLKGTDDAVHQHPYRAMGVAAGVAILIGYVAAKR